MLSLPSISVINYVIGWQLLDTHVASRLRHWNLAPRRTRTFSLTFIIQGCTLNQLVLTTILVVVITKRTCIYRMCHLEIIVYKYRSLLDIDWNTCIIYYRMQNTKSVRLLNLKDSVKIHFVVFMICFELVRNLYRSLEHYYTCQQGYYTATQATSRCLRPGNPFITSLHRSSQQWWDAYYSYCLIHSATEGHLNLDTSSHSI